MNPYSTPGDAAQPACSCGENPRVGLDDGTLMRWWAPVPASASTYRSPWAPIAAEPLWCAAIVPDVSFLFRMCLQPKAGLTDADYEAAAKRLGAEVAAIKAVAEVETKESAFDKSGRPTILYERHYFKRLSGGRHDHDHPDISGAAYGPGMYGPKSRQYERLEQAYALDSWAALQSVSWGRFQVMGEHYAMLGFPSPQHMALAMARSEKAHLDAFVAYVVATPACLQGLKHKDWAKFARGYNGKGYAKFHYDTQIAAAYARLTAPRSPPPGAPAEHAKGKAHGAHKTPSANPSSGGRLP